MKKEKETQKGKGEYMKAFLILEDGTVFTGTSIGSTKDMISEIVFNTSMTGYLEVLTDPSYAGQAVVMTTGTMASPDRRATRLSKIQIQPALLARFSVLGT